MTPPRLKEQRAHGAQRDCSVTDGAVRPARRRMLASRPEGKRPVHWYPGHPDVRIAHIEEVAAVHAVVIERDFRKRDEQKFVYALV